MSENFNDWMQRYGQKTSKIPPKCGFCEVLGINEDCLVAKFQQNCLSRFWDMDKKKHQKCPTNLGFSPFATPHDFFSKVGLCHFCTLMVP